ncbi:MAG TPA: chemotaxis response regulator protein-glutamate methylesterase [Herpetosiphonaceae bacterium]|nr:chemotaxis response regulator protein-glutamate methylesterase [Herpetosiphonaceae bacterium]
MDGVIRVLVVDDSAYIRKVVRQMLSRSPFIEVVGIARDGEEALELAEQLRPDVITLDLMMGGMDGLAFLRAQMARRPIPVVVISIANEGGEQALAALDAGAVDFVQKPTALATEKVYEISDVLIEKVKAAAQARLGRAPDAPAAPGPARKLGLDIVVIGVSTGGPQALKHLIPLLPASLPVPVAIVMHMPIGYTELYARKLDELSALEVVEARDGDAVAAGRVLLAPAGRHLRLLRGPSGVVARLDAQPADTPHRPSVDVLFRSAAEAYGQRVLGVVLTGMGTDGQQGCAWIKAKGGAVWTESEESCVIYGMPRAVDEALLSDRRLPLNALAPALVEVV